jgi:minichromosome maintenance protein 10
MDHLLALMEDEPLEDNCKSSHSKIPEHIVRQACNVSLEQKTTPALATDIQDAVHLEPQHQLSLSVDGRVGIRMIKRKISGSQLLDILTEHPYQSPASLAAMSLEYLNRLLLEPASIIDQATVCGRTNVMTVGIVFSNSGTRVASSGNAYCVVTLGSLNTGPAVSVLLFGSAYGNHCRSCIPGKVVALVNPRLIPAKGAAQGDTSISFSVNEERQLLDVADARDYGTCKAAVRGKNDNGHWVAGGKFCGHFVDKRISEYCNPHRKQANVKTGTANHTSTSALQNLRNQAVAFPRIQTRVMIPPGGVKPFQTPKQQTKLRSAQMMSDFLAQSTAPGAGCLLPFQQPTLSRSQPAMNKNTILNPKQSATKSVEIPVRGLLNPYAKGASSTASSHARGGFSPPNSVRIQDTTIRKPFTVNRVSPPASTSHSVTEDWLQKASKKRTPLGNAHNQKRQRRFVNTDTRNFNGSVPVPKPSQMFQTARITKRVPMIQTSDVKEKARAAQVLSQQQILACRLREQDGGGSQSSLFKASRPLSGADCSAVRQQDRREEFYALLDDIDIQNASAATSQFADEVSAEEYARSRRVVTELEEQEGKKQSKVAKSKTLGDKDKTAIRKEWYCQQCRKSSPFKPAGCVRRGHSVATKREIVQAKSTSERRLDLASKDANDGGLTLGSGIEWSANRWSRFN